MHLYHLSLTDFRNFARLDVDLPLGAIVLVGDNAQGKTSLLEAIYFLATFTSFHASSDRELVNFLTATAPLSVARIVADFCRGEASHRLEVRVIQETDEVTGHTRVRKEALLDGARQRLGELVGRFNAVLFLPHMLRIIDGPPEERRRYLDLALAQTSPAYGPTLSAYGRSLSQRNALLKQLNERGGDLSQLDYWDEQLARLGAQVVYARIHAIRELERLGARVHQELTRGGEVLRLDYRPAYEPLQLPKGQYSLALDAPVDRSGLSLEEIQNGFYERLAQLRESEIARGVTTIGPQRDDLLFLSNGVNLGMYGSRGQVRTTLLTLKLAEVAWMKEKTGFWPVLLLDEVLAELDNERREDLLGRVMGVEQAVLTTTDLNLFTPSFVDQAEIWRVAAGRVG
jgi:DNA replication and repair protein RecF